MTRDFAERALTLVNRVEDSEARLSDTVVRQGDDLVERLGRVTQRLHETLIERGEAMGDRLDGSSERFAAALHERAENTSAVLDAAAQRWSERFDAREAQLRGAIDGQTAVVEALMDVRPGGSWERSRFRARPPSPRSSRSPPHRSRGWIWRPHRSLSGSSR